MLGLSEREQDQPRQSDPWPLPSECKKGGSQQDRKLPAGMVCSTARARLGGGRPRSCSDSTLTALGTAAAGSDSRLRPACRCGPTREMSDGGSAFNKGVLCGIDYGLIA